MDFKKGNQKMKRKIVISIFLVLVIAAAGIVIGVKWFYYVPELSMTDITFMPEDPIVNVDTETFNTKIQNTGKVEAGSFDICLFDNGKLVDSKVIDGLDKEKFVDITFNYIFSTIGHHTIDLIVDCNGKIREKVKLNNKVTFDIEIKESPVSETSLNPSQAPPTITATVFKKQLGSDWFASNYGGSSPAIHNGKVYVGGKNQYFFCLNKDTGEEIWKYEVKSAGLHPGIYSEPVFYNGNVYFGSTGSNLIESGGHVFALNAENGSLAWEYKTDSDVYSLSLSNGEIFAASQNGAICRIDASSGKLVRKYAVPEGISMSSSIVVSKGKIYILGETTLFCIDAETGNTLWTFKGEKYIISTPIVYDEKVYLDGRYCLDGDTGSLIWENKEVERGSQVLDGDLFAVTVDGKILCIDAVNGQTIWKRTMESSVAPPFIYNQRMYIGTTTNKVYCIGEYSGDTIAIYKTKDVITTRSLAYKGKIYVVADDGYLYCFEEK